MGKKPWDAFRKLMCGWQTHTKLVRSSGRYCDHVPAKAAKGKRAGDAHGLFLSLFDHLMHYQLANILFGSRSKQHFTKTLKEFLVNVCICLHTNVRRPRSALPVFLCCCLPYFGRQGLSLKQALTDLIPLAGQWVPRAAPVPRLQHWGQLDGTTMLCS